MSECYVCGRLLDKEHQTEEHIILNALGGKLKSKDLICRECNSDFGDAIDSVLAHQFNAIANLLNIQRDRGMPPCFEMIEEGTNAEYLCAPGGKPVMKKPEIIQGENHITVKVRDRKQAKEVLEGLKRKHPEIDVERLLENVNQEAKYLNHSMKFEIKFGGNEAFRSLCKTAVNFYILKKGNRKNIQGLLEYIKGETEDTSIVRPFYLDADPVCRMESEILHSIIIKGDARNKVLCAYIEVFDFYRVLVLMNDYYEGEDVEFSYFFDVITREEVSREYSLPSAGEMVSLCEQMSYRDNIAALKRNLEPLMQKIMKKQESEHIGELLQKVIKKIQSKYSGIEYDEEQVRKEIVEDTMRVMDPWIRHIFNPQK